jgi:hypothetical protein
MKNNLMAMINYKFINTSNNKMMSRSRVLAALASRRVFSTSVQGELEFTKQKLEFEELKNQIYKFEVKQAGKYQ